MYFDNGQEFKLVVRTTKKGNAQKQVMDLTSQLSKQYELPIEVIANSPRNFRAIQNILENQGSKIGRQYKGFQKIAYIPEKDAIYLGFYQPDLNQQEQIKSKIKKISGMDVVVDFLPRPINLTSVIGGGVLQDSKSSRGICTAGFTGTMNSIPGFITATHCIGKFDTYLDNANNKYRTGIPITLYIMKYHLYQSILAYSSAPIISEVYRTGWVSQAYLSNLPITGLGNYSDLKTGYAYNGDYVGGTTLCHIGKTTGFSCGSVYLVSGSLIECNASQKGLILIKDCGHTAISLRGKQLVQDSGDSGGPYFDGSGKAYGLATAGITTANDTSIVDISSLRYLNNFQLKTSVK